MVDPDILTAIQKYFRSLDEHGIHPSFGVLYGSRARGDADEWSDIDLIVVAPEYDRQLTHHDLVKLFQIAVRTDSRIEPIPCGERMWVEDDASAIIEIARREGQRIECEGREAGAPA